MPDYPPPSNWKELLRLLLRQRRRFEVSGNSMLPGLKAGDIVLINPRTRQSHHLTYGDIVVAKHPIKKDVRIIKRISKIEPDGRYFLSGDNLAESTDSHSFGSLGAEYILGKVTSRFTPGKG